MAADRRNTFVVTALVVSMTAGAQALLWLEPGTPHWKGETLLMAERGMRVERVEVGYAAASADAAALGWFSDDNDSILLIHPDGEVAWEPRGPRVRLVVIGSDANRLGKEQQETLLWALGNMSRASGLELVPVQLAANSDTRQNPDLPPQAADLRELLVRKGIIE